jgi:hypothetical protein
VQCLQCPQCPGLRYEKNRLYKRGQFGPPPPQRRRPFIKYMPPPPPLCLAVKYKPPPLFGTGLTRSSQLVTLWPTCLL